MRIPEQRAYSVMHYLLLLSSTTRNILVRPSKTKAKYTKLVLWFELTRLRRSCLAWWPALKWRIGFVWNFQILGLVLGFAWFLFRIALITLQLRWQILGRSHGNQLGRCFSTLTYTQTWTESSSWYSIRAYWRGSWAFVIFSLLACCWQWLPISQAPWGQTITRPKRHDILHTYIISQTVYAAMLYFIQESSLLLLIPQPTSQT
jgi:hypothetical protein